MRLLEEAREPEGNDRVEAERLRRPREVHDALAHTVTVIGVHADVTDELLPDDPHEGFTVSTTPPSTAATRDS